jgi:hypothetical protein
MFTFNKETNEIFQDEKAIGIFDPATGTAATVAELPPASKGQLRKAIQEHGVTVLAFGIADKVEEVAAEVKPAAPEVKPEAKPEAKPAAPASGASIPPPPVKDPALGDKTPAFIEYLRAYAPEEYKRRRLDKRVTYETRVVLAK